MKLAFGTQAERGRSSPRNSGRHNLQLTFIILSLVAGPTLRGIVFSTQGGDFRLNFVSWQQSGPKIHLTADPGPIYVIEKSTNLVEWKEAISGALTNGFLELIDSDVPGVRATFYRGRAGDATNAAVAVGVDQSRYAFALITPAEGGSCALTNDDGVRFTFTVAPFNVFEAVPIVMTLVTNLTGLPETEGRPAAVQFEPDGFRFAGIGTLEISFPTNLSVLALSSFGISVDGTELYLVPDTVDTNNVRIDMSHFSGRGTAAWSAKGRSAMQNRTVSAANTAEHSFGSAQAKHRQDRREGRTPPDPAAEARRIGTALWRELIQAHLNDAKTDCSVAQSLVAEMRNIERYLNEMHAETGTEWAIEHLRQMEDGVSPALICNCVKEAQEKCKRGEFSGGESQLHRTESMRIKLGVSMEKLGSCVAAEPPVEYIEDLADRWPCNGRWNGTVVLVENHIDTEDYDDDFANTHEHSTWTSLYEFTGQVVAWEETYSDDQGNASFDLTVEGIPAVNRTYNRNEVHGVVCTEIGSVVLTSSKPSEPPKPQQGHLTFRFKKGHLGNDLEFYPPLAEFTQVVTTSKRWIRDTELCRLEHPVDESPPPTVEKDWLSAGWYTSEMKAKLKVQKEDITSGKLLATGSHTKNYYNNSPRKSKTTVVTTLNVNLQ